MGGARTLGEVVRQDWHDPDRGDRVVCGSGSRGAAADHGR